jgi:uncharacterized protein (DUF924 family)
VRLPPSTPPRSCGFGENLGLNAGSPRTLTSTAVLGTAEGALGLVLLLDQFPRNAFRGSPRMYGTDEAATVAARAALAARHDQALPEELRVFLYLPFSHSEHLADQQRAVDLCRVLDAESLTHAEAHRDIIWRFGRFPHRNAILGRPGTAEEAQYLADGGFLG